MRDLDDVLVHAAAAAARARLRTLGSHRSAEAGFLPSRGVTEARAP